MPPLLSNDGHAEYRYVLAVGMQISHELNRPLMGVAHVSCSVACKCQCKWSHHGAFNSSCLFDGLAKGRATVTAFVRLLAAQQDGERAGEHRGCRSSQCAVTVRNSPDPEEARRRVIVRSLMIGFNEHVSSKWLNTYHLDGTGLTAYRRRLAVAA